MEGHDPNRGTGHGTDGRDAIGRDAQGRRHRHADGDADDIRDDGEVVDDLDVLRSGAAVSAVAVELERAGTRGAQGKIERGDCLRVIEEHFGTRVWKDRGGTLEEVQTVVAEDVIVNGQGAEVPGESVDEIERLALAQQARRVLMHDVRLGGPIRRDVQVHPGPRTVIVERYAAQRGPEEPVLDRGAARELQRGRGRRGHPHGHDLWDGRLEAGRLPAGW